MNAGPDKSALPLGYDYFSGSSTLVVSGCKQVDLGIIANHFPDVIHLIVGEGTKCVNQCTMSDFFLEKLRTIIIPSTVTDIQENTFNFCFELKSIEVSPNNINYSSDDGVLFDKCRTTLLMYPQNKPGALYLVPDTVTKIEAGAFFNCQTIESIKIPDSVTYIGEGAFSECVLLESITLPESVKDIGEGAFEDCPALNSVTLPDTIVKIRKNVFNLCTSLESITIPDSVTEIEDGAFKCCESLHHITLPDSLKKLGDAFDGCESLALIILKTEKIRQLVEERLPDTVDIEVVNECGMKGNKVEEWSLDTDTHYDPATKTLFINKSGKVNLSHFIILFPQVVHLVIGPKTTNVVTTGPYWTGWKNLKDVEISESVTEIGNCAFAGCELLESIKLPNSVKIIGDAAFANCRSLTNFKLPDQVEELGSDILFNCEKIIELTIPCSVIKIDPDVLEGSRVFMFTCEADIGEDLFNTICDTRNELAPCYAPYSERDP